MPPTRSRSRSATRTTPEASAAEAQNQVLVIASVKGAVGARCPDHVVVECGGVGYRLNVSSQTLRKVPPVGSEVRLLAHLIAREDSLQLYGFAIGAPSASSS